VMYFGLNMLMTTSFARLRRSVVPTKQPDLQSAPLDPASPQAAYHANDRGSRRHEPCAWIDQGTKNIP
jgi:hypothetical protein